MSKPFIVKVKTENFKVRHFTLSGNQLVYFIANILEKHDNKIKVSDPITGDFYNAIFTKDTEVVDMGEYIVVAALGELHINFRNKYLKKIETIEEFALRKFGVKL